MLVTVAAADSAEKVQKKSTAFLYIAKRNQTLCVLQYMTSLMQFVLSSMRKKICIRESSVFWRPRGPSNSPVAPSNMHACNLKM